MNAMQKCLAFLFFSSSLVVSPARAELIYGATLFRDLVTFDSSSPNLILTSTAITGLVDQNMFESIAAIDFRPATGQLYALGNAPGNIYRIYTINPTTAVASQVGANITFLSGIFMGFDFNPVSDQLRIVTDTDQNYRFNPTTGALVNSDPAVAYAAGDANQGINPNVVGVAYNNNVLGASSTTLFAIDDGLDILATQNPATGVLTTVGNVGVDLSSTLGFDISGATGTAYVSSANTATFSSNLFTIDLATGAASLVGEIGSSLIINDIAAAPAAVPEPSGLGLTVFSMGLLASRRRRKAAGLAAFL